MKRGVAESLPALQQSRSELAHYDSCRDRLDVHRRVRHLALVGTSERETAALTGLSHVTVHDIRHSTPEPDRPQVPDHRVSDARADELETTAKLALRLSVLLRDEDPNLVWGALSRLDRRQLQELVVVALAAIPVDGWSASELYGWVSNLPAAQEGC